MQSKALDVGIKRLASRHGVEASSGLVTITAPTMQVRKAFALVSRLGQLADESMMNGQHLNTAVDKSSNLLALPVRTPSNQIRNDDQQTADQHPGKGSDYIHVIESVSLRRPNTVARWRTAVTPSQHGTNHV
jgi:hypothetical protein